MSYDVMQGFLWRDETSDLVVEQNYDATQGVFVPQASANTRTVTNAQGQTQVVADRTVTVRGSKNLIWSSEGYTSLLGQTVVALTTLQKEANGSDEMNIGGTAPLDFSPYQRLVLIASLVSLTGGSSPSLTFGITFQDDETSPLVVPAWSSAALTAAGGLYAAIGSGLSGSAPSAPSGWTFALQNLALAPNGHFTWTLAGAPTGASWKATLYGLN